MVKLKNKSGNSVNLRQIILKTSLNLFSSKGYFNTSVHDIRRTAGVSIGAVYHHFKSKEEIAEAIYSDLLDSVTKAMDERILGYNTASLRCKAIMGLLFEMAETHPAEMEFMLYSKHQEFMPSAIPICSSRPLTIMREIVQQGIDAGEIREMDVTLATTCLFGAMFRMINLRLDGTIEDFLPTHLEDIWKNSWRGISK